MLYPALSTFVERIYHFILQFLNCPFFYTFCHILIVRIPATSYLVPLFTLIYLVLLHLLLPSYLNVPCYLNNRQRYCSVWPEKDWTHYNLMFTWWFENVNPPLFCMVQLTFRLVFKEIMNLNTEVLIFACSTCFTQNDD
jgi:cellulose synthase/poly-beta-1,6-N-acetylglucosamine synthase-like glycosyltransferase